MCVYDHTWYNRLLDVCQSSFYQILNTPFNKINFSHEQYLAKEELGRGGMGIVYLCYDRKLNKEVAVKVIGWSFDSESVLRFHKEAKTLAKLHHPNILRVEHFGHSDDDSFFLVMDLLTGRSLSELIEAQKLPSFEEALEIFIQICDGLSHAHSKGILHRDIKPSNVFVARYKGGELQVVITDFGLAKLVAEDQSLTQTGFAMGSPPYMSPEQCDREGRPVDQRSDLYSLGCLMFELLTTTKPFLGESIPHLMMQHISEEPPKLSDRAPDYNYPEEIEQIIAKCLAKNPDDRYAEAKQLRADLQELKDSIVNVSFAEHSENSGAYSPSQSFLRTGAYLISGYQNMMRPKNEKRLLLAFVLLVGVLGTLLYFAVSSLTMLYSKENVTIEERGNFIFGKDQTGIALNPVKAGPVKVDREPGRLRQNKLWIHFDKDVGKALKETTSASNEKINFGDMGHLNPDWLDLHESDVKDDDLAAIKSLNIRGINLNKTGVTDKALEILSKIDTLEELYVDETKITDRGMKYLVRLGDNRLNLLTLAKTNVTDAAIESISKFGKLAWLGLDNCKNVTGANIDLLRNNSDLFHLGLAGSGFKPENLAKLSKLDIGGLPSLDISSLNLTDADLRTLAEAKVPNLSTLYFRNNKDVTDQGLLEVASIKPLSNIHIQGCDKITPDGIERFRKARNELEVVAVFTQDE